jgi:glyoxylase-like metal-dependent hydrolase (beta-lactamase superfamily II)
MVVDTGLAFRGMTRYILNQVQRGGYQPRDVRLILLTHGHVDHAGNAAALKRVTGAPIALHRGDSEMVQRGAHGIPPGRNIKGRATAWLMNSLPWQYGFESFTPDIWIERGQTLADFGIEGYVVETPGHSAGSISLVLEDGQALIGDALLNTTKVGFPIYWEDKLAATESARRIHSLRPRLLHTGHGRSFTGDELARFVENL